MATFLEVCRAIAPDARLETSGGGTSGADPAARTIGWVRVLKPRVPAFDALDPGDLAIVPAGALAVVAPVGPELDALVDALAGADVAGVLLVDDESAAPGAAGRLATSALRDALVERGLPVVQRASGDPVALERSAIAYLVNRRAELDRQARELERDIEALVLAGRGPEALAAAIAGFVGRPVVLERRRGDPLAIHVPGDRPESLAAGAAAVAAYRAKPSAVPFRYPLPGGSPGAGGAGGAGGGGAGGAAAGGTDGAGGGGTGGAGGAAGGGARPVGSIVLLGDDPVRERERVGLERIATVVALALGGAPVEPTPAGGREVLPAVGPPWVVLIARQAGEGVADERLETREQLRREVRLYAGPDRLVLRGDAASLELRAVVGVTPEDPAAAILGERVGAILGRLVAISRRFVDPALRPNAEAEARATLEAAERLPAADRPALARADRIAAYRLLGDLHHLPDAVRSARGLLEPILVGSEGTQRERLATLRAALERDAGSDVADALGVHRNTVAYRLRRIEELTGWDLTDPDLRLAIAVAVRIVQSEQ